VPEAKPAEFKRVARKLGFEFLRQKGSHERWAHPDGRATTIPNHPSTTISGRLFYDILRQMGTTEKEFNELK
jgi:predicted RNA binding protein YcfA (HicA-like mRNA interferase family)